MDKTRQDITLGRLAMMWLAERRASLKRSSVSTYALIISKHLSPRLGEHRVVTEADVRDFVETLSEKGLSRPTIEGYLRVLKMILRWAETRGLIGHVSVEKLAWPVSRPQAIQVLSVEQQRKLLRYLLGRPTPKNMGLWISLSTGMRIGELCALRWGDIDTANKVIFVRRTLNRIYRDGNLVSGATEINIDRPKTAQSERTVPICAELLKALRVMKRLAHADYYVITNSARPTEPAVYRRYYNRLMAGLGMDGIRFHALRHTFATRCVECNVDYKVIAGILGHASISTTLNTYVHPSERVKRQAVSKMLRRVLNGQ